VKISIHVPDELIDSAIAHAKTAHWAKEVKWGRVDGSCEGHVLEQDPGSSTGVYIRHWLGSSRLKSALELMAEGNHYEFSGLMCGDVEDGDVGSVLLQLMCFGERRHG